MYHIVICDDEREILKKIEKRIKTGFKQSDIPAVYTVLTDSRELVNVLDSKPVDILFLDIDMPYFGGMEIAKMITDRGYKTLLVFVTSHDALVYQTFAYRPFAFIRKSYFEEEADEVIRRLEKELIALHEELVIQKGQEVIKIPIDNICYMESEGNYINIRTIDGNEKYRNTLTNIEKEFAGKNFVRCHKGYLVNLKHISRLRNSEIELTGGMIIPIGRSYEKDVKRRILELMRC